MKTIAMALGAAFVLSVIFTGSSPAEDEIRLTDLLAESEVVAADAAVRDELKGQAFDARGRGDCPT